MATSKPRFSISVSDDIYQQIIDYQHEHRLSTQTKAILIFIEKGIEAIQNEKNTLKKGLGTEQIYTTMSPPDEAMKLARDYWNLDLWGRQAVRNLLETETSRCEDESQFRNEEEPEEPKVINLYLEPAAAGIAAPTLGADYEHYELKPEDPPGAAYAVRLQGDSMEPYFPDGTIVFVNHDALRDGDIGIFSVDGGTVCKQYHQEGGVVYLFSLNRKRQDADVVFFPGGNRSLVCQGRVMTPRRIPVPGRD